MSEKIPNKIIIFDLDGTLIHSIPDMCIAMNKTLEHFSLRTISEEKLEEFVGEGMLKLSDYLTEMLEPIAIPLTEDPNS